MRDGYSESMKLEDDSNCYDGIEADFNLLFKIKRLALTMGVTTVKFKYFEASVGIGVWF